MLWHITKIVLALPLFAVLLVLCIPGLVVFGIYALIVLVLNLLGFGGSIDALTYDIRNPY